MFISNSLICMQYLSPNFLCSIFNASIYYMRISAFTFLLTSPIPLLPPIQHQLWKRHCFISSTIAISTLPLKFLSKWCFIYQNYKLKLLVLNGLLTQYMDYIITFIILASLIIFKGRLLPFGEICLNDFKLTDSV